MNLSLLYIQSLTLLSVPLASSNTITGLSPPVSVNRTLGLVSISPALSKMSGTDIYRLRYERHG
jgi:hypothetical protein